MQAGERKTLANVGSMLGQRSSHASPVLRKVDAERWFVKLFRT